MWQTLVTDFPYFLLSLAIFRPYTLPNSIRMQVLAKGGGINIVSLPFEKGSIFENLVTEMKLLVDGETFVNIFKSVITGRFLLPFMRGFLQTLGRVKPNESLIKEATQNRSFQKKVHFMTELHKISFNWFPYRTQKA